jgi:hypothetical protein
MGSGHFRFLDLPPEMRFMVYERLPRSIKHHRFNQWRYPKTIWSLIFVTRSVPVPILATCRLVHSEARDIVRQSAKKFVLQATPKVLCMFEPDCPAIKTLNGIFSPLSDGYHNSFGEVLDHR